MEKISNHPVHITNENHEMYPTALIPFCDIGGNLSIMGVKIDQFDVPVCKSFKAVLYKDQLCYAVDPNRFRENFDKKQQLSLTLAIDYNKDRIFHFSSGGKENKEEAQSFDTPFQDSSESITIETIGKNKK